MLTLCKVYVTPLGNLTVIPTLALAAKPFTSILRFVTSHPLMLAFKTSGVAVKVEVNVGSINVAVLVEVGVGGLVAVRVKVGVKVSVAVGVFDG